MDSSGNYQSVLILEDLRNVIYSRLKDGWPHWFIKVSQGHWRALAQTYSPYICFGSGVHYLFPWLQTFIIVVKICFTTYSQGIQPRCPLFSKSITWSPSASPLSRGDPINNIMSSSQMVINYRQGFPAGEAMGYYDTQSSLRTRSHLSGPCWACFSNLVSMSCWDVMTTVEPEKCWTNQHIRDRKQWLSC